MLRDKWHGSCRIELRSQRSQVDGLGAAQWLSKRPQVDGLGAGQGRSKRLYMEGLGSRSMGGAGSEGALIT